MPRLLQSLHDLSEGNKDEQQIIALFDAAAIQLFRNSLLITGNKAYRLREVEFYFNDLNLHVDPYCHRHYRQGLFGEWYFHRFKSVISFKKSLRNGIDITFGNPKHKTFGGILLRKIEDIQDKRLIAGINIVTRQLIDPIQEDSLELLATSRGNYAFRPDSPFRLSEQVIGSTEPIFKSQRFGLSLPTDDKRKQFYKKLYCYYNHDLNPTEIRQIP